MPVVFAGNLPRGYRKDELLDFVSKYPPDEVSLKAGYAFLTYFERADAEDVIDKYNGQWFGGNRILLEKQRGPRARRRDRSYGRSPRRPQRYQRRIEGKYHAVIVDIPSECSWQDLKDFAREHGAPRSMTTEVVRRDGNRTGLLAFRSKRDMENAVDALDGKKVRPGRGAPHTYKPAIVQAFSEVVPSKSLSRSSRGSYSRSRSRSRYRGRSRSRSQYRRGRSSSPYRRGRSLSRSVYRRGRSRSRSEYRYRYDKDRSRSSYRKRSRSKSYRRKQVRSKSPRRRDSKRSEPDRGTSGHSHKVEQRSKSKSPVSRRDRSRSKADRKTRSESKERPDSVYKKEEIQEKKSAESSKGIRRSRSNSHNKEKGSSKSNSKREARTSEAPAINENRGNTREEDRKLGLEELPAKQALVEDGK